MTTHSEATVDAVAEVTAGVVVGVDGSPQALAALRWAFEDAARRGAAVHVVRAWTLAAAAGPVAFEQGLAFGMVPSEADCEAQVRAELETVVARAKAEAGDPQVPTTLHVVHGSAVRVLLAAGEHADVLVVGHRGVGGFLGLLLGSTAEQVLRHAPCTVVVVRS